MPDTCSNTSWVFVLAVRAWALPLAAIVIFVPPVPAAEKLREGIRFADLAGADRNGAT